MIGTSFSAQIPTTYERPSLTPCQPAFESLEGPPDRAEPHGLCSYFILHLRRVRGERAEHEFKRWQGLRLRVYNECIDFRTCHLPLPKSKGYQGPEKGENHESSFGDRRPISVGDRRHDIEQYRTFILST